MIYITPNTWLSNSYRTFGSLEHQYYTPRQYLWRQYNGDMQPTPDSVLITALYDISHDMSETKKRVMDYRFLQRHLPFFRSSHPNSLSGNYDYLHALHHTLSDKGLWEGDDILKTSPQVHSPMPTCGWSHIPKYLSSWLKTCDEHVTPPQIFVYDTPSDIGSHIDIESNKRIVILDENVARGPIKASLLTSGIPYSEDKPKTFSDYQLCNKILALLTLDTHTIEPKRLVQLLWMPHQSETAHLATLFTLLHSFPKSFCTLKELTTFLVSQRSDDIEWLKTLFAHIPENSQHVSMHECVLTLQKLYRHLHWRDDALWLQWIQIFTPSRTIQEKRSYHSWWELLSLISELISVSEPHALPIQISSSSRALYAPSDIIYIPTTLLYSDLSMPSLPAEASLKLIEEHNKAGSQVLHRYKSFLSQAQNLSQTTAVTHHQWAPRSTHPLQVHPQVKISWIRTLQSYTKCPRLGWIEQHLLPKHAPVASSFDLSPSLRGILIHEWMSSHQSCATSFIHAWLQNRGLPKVPNEIKAWSYKLEKIREHWNSLLQEHAWMRSSMTWEKSCSLQRQGFEGNLRIDLILKRPEGLVIIDFKTTATTLSPAFKHAGLMPQLPLYWMSQHEPVVALAYAHLSPDAIKFTGISCVDTGLFPITHNEQEWASLGELWEDDINQTLHTVKSGNTDPTPFTPHHSCDQCPVEMLCQPK